MSGGCARVGRAALVLSALAIGAAGAPPAAAGDGGDVAIANDAIDDLTASLPGLVPVEGGGRVADVAECDGARKAHDLATAATSILQSYGGEAGGSTGQIVIFDSKKKAQRFFRLVTDDDAVACTVATTEVGLAPLSGGAEASADLERNKTSGLKRSITYEGTITVGTLVYLEKNVAVRRGKVVIVGTAGESAGAGAGLGTIITEWVTATAHSF